LTTLIGTHEAGKSYRSIADDEFYGARLRRLAALRLQVVRSHAKFKVGPSASNDVKRRVAAALRKRNEPNDARAADVIEASLK
jgi:hypothetical protein